MAMLDLSNQGRPGTEFYARQAMSRFADEQVAPSQCQHENYRASLTGSFEGRSPFFGTGWFDPKWATTMTTAQHFSCWHM